MLDAVNYHAIEKLRDGRNYIIRAQRRDDDIIEALHLQAGLRSFYLRFLTRKKQLSSNKFTQSRQSNLQAETPPPADNECEITCMSCGGPLPGRPGFCLAASLEALIMLPASHSDISYGSLKNALHPVSRRRAQGSTGNTRIL